MGTSLGAIKRKVAIVGVGYVGASISYALMIKDLAREIVFIECPEKIEKCKAEMNDIRHGIPYMGSSNIYCGGYNDIKDCDLIIITAGRNRNPDETRLEMTEDSLNTTLDVAKEIKEYYTTGVILIVTNPIDIITRAMSEWLDLPEGKIFGTGCVLDSSRFTNVIADYVGLSTDSISAYVIGEHGDGQIALWSKVTIAGIPIADYCQMTGIPFTEKTKYSIEQSVRNMGMEIIKGKGRTHYSIATCVCYIADAILNNRPTIVSVSSVLRGEYGIEGIALSLPSVIDSGGLVRRLTDQLIDNEQSKLREVSDLLASVWISE